MLPQSSPQGCSNGRCWKNADIDELVLADKTIAILGYGSHGRAQALNLRDGGYSVVIGARLPEEGGTTGWNNATADGFKVLSMTDAVQQAQVVMLMLPDHCIGPVAESLPLTSSHYVGLCHGFCLHAGLWQPKAELSVFLLSPKSHGIGVRQEFLSQTGVPGFMALVQAGNRTEDDIADVALAYGKAIGCGYHGIYPTTVAEETVCDVFSEQAVLCGGLNHLILAAYETLIEAGYREEIAVVRCLYELKALAALLNDRGITGLRQAISPVALIGDITRGPRVIDAHVKTTLKQLLTEVEDGTFARDFQDNLANLPQLRQTHAKHPIESACQKIAKDRKNNLATTAMA